LAHTLDSRDVALSAIVLETASKKVFLSGELNPKDVDFADQQLNGTENQTLFCGGAASRETGRANGEMAGKSVLSVMACLRQLRLRQ